MQTTKLYRPVGVTELKLIKESGWKVYPPRLDWQPIFYPVLDKEYAAKIAKDWNTPDEFSGYAGFVTAFEIPTNYFNEFEVQNVGASNHNEIWVKSEDLETFNSKIIEKIKVIQAFYGDKYEGIKTY
jgi:hypothetical protein